MGLYIADFKCIEAYAREAHHAPGLETGQHFHLPTGHVSERDGTMVIFFDSLKIGDLGLGRVFSSETIEAYSKVGTPLYMSPEVNLFLRP